MSIDKIISFIKKEFKDFLKGEVYVFSFIIIFVFILSLISKSSVVSIISALCGITYTIFAGKGKVICYFIGMIGTFCYCYLAFKNAFWGNLALYGLYYFPMEIIGIFKWLSHYKKDKNEIIKTRLDFREKVLIYPLILIFCFLSFYLLNLINSKNPYLDSVTLVLSIFAQYLTVKRCVEQWYFWSFVNLLSFVMWFLAFLGGERCFATVLMWGVYFILGIYFLVVWRKDLKQKNC